tara:strand:+ start:916 stop:5076 length:4161 start_codon:yes stop_codon:yes gene_type:complete
MANKFKGFNNQQTHQLLTELGYTGPAQKDDMDKFVAATPTVASMLGRYNEMARQRVEGGPVAPIGMQAGGALPKTPLDLYWENFAAQKKQAKTSGQPTLVDTYLRDDTAQDDMAQINFPDGTAVSVQKGFAEAYLNHAKNTNIQLNTVADYNALSQKISAGTENPNSTEAQIHNQGNNRTLQYRNTKQGKSRDDFIQESSQYNVQGKSTSVPQVTGEVALAGGNTGVALPEGLPKFIQEKATPDTTVSQAIADKDTAQKAVEQSERIQLEKEARAKATTDTTVADTTVAEKDTAAADIPIEQLPPTIIGQSELDAAQKAYADAQKTLTDAQTALNNATEPEANPFTDPTALENITATYLSSDANVKYNIDFDTYHRDGVGKSGVMSADVKAILESGKMPSDPTKYDEAELNKGSSDNWTFKFDNGQTVVIRRDNKEDAIASFNNLAKMLTDFKESDLFKNNRSPEQIAYEQLMQNVTDAEELITTTEAEVAAAQKRFETTEIPSTAEALGKAITDPTGLTTKADVSKITEETDQLIGTEKGQIGEVSETAVKLATAKIAKDIEADSVNTYNAIMSQSEVTAALEKLAAATGTPSEGALSKAETMTPEELAQLNLDPATQEFLRDIPIIKRNLDNRELPTSELFNSYTRSIAQQFEGEVDEIDGAKFASDTPQARAQVNYNLTPTEIATAEATKIQQAATFAEYATAEEKKSEFIPAITAETGTVTADELVDLNKILNNEAVVVTGRTLEALNEASTAKAASATFSQQLEATAVKGEVSAQSTISFQLGKLMESFNDGTPAWAAGALRNVNAAMNARGLGASSMAAAAMVQASMEVALPIAQADASIFQAMDMENVRNAQAVALANAAAAQNFELANLSNRQAVNIQNSMNNANLSLRNLSNTQEAVLASAQFKAALQGQELSISSNVSLANAARFAQVNDINLSNAQQTSILRSTQALEVDLTNLSNVQQTALSNLQVKAAMMGQELTNEQQVAVLETTQAFDIEMQNATRKQQAFIQDAASRAAMEGRVLDNRQQTSLFNVGNEVAERGIELNNEQQATMFNMTNKMTIDVENLSNRQQSALATAQIEAAMKGQELTNRQQVNIVRTERIAEIANMQFTADQQTAIRNSELAQTVDLANLNNTQAKILADAAAMSQVDVTNLNNRQQAAQQKAAAFLSFDLEGLSNEQQIEIFKGQSEIQSILSDQAAENGQLQFNAQSTNQVEQFFANLDAQVDMFSTAQENAIEQFNVGEENVLSKFDSELSSQRDMFNASNELVVAQANTQWRQNIATINNAASNEANMRDAMAANNLTTQGIAELWQQERDLMNYAWTTAEKQADRDHQLVTNKIQADSAEDSGFSMAAGKFLSATIGAIAETGGISKFFS